MANGDELLVLPGIILGGAIVNSFINNNLQGLILTLLTLLPAALVLLTGDFNINGTKGMYAFYTICNITTYFATQIHQRIKSKEMSLDFDFPVFWMFFLGLSVIGGGVFMVASASDRLGDDGSEIARNAATFVGSILITYGFSMLVARHGKGLGYYQGGSATDNVKCTRPATQAFKCTLYDANGKVLEAPWDSNVPIPSSSQDDDE